MTVKNLVALYHPNENVCIIYTDAQGNHKEINCKVYQVTWHHPEINERVISSIGFDQGTENHVWGLA